MSGIRRVFTYIVSLVTLGIFAAGIRTLLFLLFDTLLTDPAAIGRPGFVQQQLSLGLAMLIIGGPLWFVFWRNAQQHTDGNPTEIGSISRQTFLNLILIVTALMTLFAAQDFLKWLISGAPRTLNAAGSIATMIVAALIWYYYWRVSDAEGHPSQIAKTLRRWYIYITAGWGLIFLIMGIVELVNSGVLSLRIWGDSLASTNFLSSGVSNNLPGIILGGIWWAFHWFRLARNDIDSALRQVYLHLFAITGSAIAGLVALVIGLNQIFVWVFGFADNGAVYFQFLGWVIPLIVVSGGFWSYHRTLAQEESGQILERRLSAKRIHLYIMSFLGLGTLVSGLVILLGVLLNLLAESISPPIIAEAGWWQKQLSLALALLIVAMPIWWYYWNQIVSMAAHGVAEWKARSRRIYLYGIVAAAILGLAADLVNIIYQIMSNALTGNFGINTFRNSIWSIQSLIAATPLLIYHWRIVRGDQRRGAEIPAARKIVTLLAGGESKELVSRLEGKLGGKVQFLQVRGGGPQDLQVTDEDIVSLIKEIESSPTAKVMLIAYTGKLLVIPYQEK